MGFSVSASAAIIFISFLIAASTLYTAWDSSYSDVQAAREDWYNLRLSQLNTLVGLDSSLGVYRHSSGTDYYNVTFYIKNSGLTMHVPDWSGVYDGKYVTLKDVNDDNVGFIGNYTYVLPGETLLLNVTRIPLNQSQHTLTIVLENGCWLRLSWHWNGSTVLLDGQSKGCPAGVG
ncbi:flagellin [Thermococcus zilligii]|uniref:flagellin n=1 Tax=Thermococcus zilligii TaxID=54076 RepID=UPI000299DFB2|nr:flagellin [Thermococcus zilligii]